MAHGAVPDVSALHGWQGVGVSRRYVVPRRHGTVSGKTPALFSLFSLFFTSIFFSPVGRDAGQDCHQYYRSKTVFCRPDGDERTG